MNLVIAQLVPELNHGGVERGTIEVANYIAQQGFQSIVISNGGRLQKQLDGDVEHIQLDLGKKSLTTLFKVRKLRKVMADKGINIIHARSRLPAWIAFRAIAGMKSSAKPKFITTVHGLYSVKKYSSIMARGDRVVAVSETAKAYVEDNYADCLKHPVKLIYRGIKPEDFPYGVKDESFGESFYQEHPQLKNRKRVLLPGRLTSLKGLEELHPWLSKTEAKLLLTANQDSNKNTQKAYQWLRDNGFESKVCWLGFQPQIQKLYGLVDLVVSASTRPESFGRTVAESLATATPVVGYAHGGVKEILEKVYPQGLVTAGDAVELGEKIESLLAKPVKVPDIQPFRLSSMLSQTLELYKESLSDNS